MSKITVDTVEPATGTSLTLGASGDTITVPAGATITNSGTASGFGTPAYAANASASTGAVNIDSSNNLQFNSGYGSTVTAFGVRAWVNFDGTGTLSVKASGNL